MQSALDIHEEAVKRSKSFVFHQGQLIEILVQVIQRRVFEVMGYNSLREYCLGALKLTENQTYTFMSIAKKSLEVPEIKTLVAQGEMTISNARAIAPHLTQENKAQWLEKATTLSQHELEKEVVKEHPRAHVKERTKPIAEDLYEDVTLMTEEDKKTWARCVEVYLLTKRENAEKREMKRATMEAYLDAFDPIRLAKKAEAKRAARQEKAKAKPAQPKPPTPQATQTGPARPFPSFKRSAIPAPVERQVWLRDQGQCSHKGPDGKRCSCKAFLHVHHIRPIAKGGGNNLENLVLVCRTHHAFIHAGFSKYSVRRAAGAREKGLR